ncbi:hypothetical protein [Streptomyces sp. NPDC056387]|uniref:hypothetical protein n=1 Tax=Streptomyces sp. NPDC056387 TaxID=3345803 RepID=UPI0035E2FFA4
MIECALINFRSDHPSGAPVARMKAKQLVTSFFLTAAVVVAPLAMASPASASAQDCGALARALGYKVGPKVAAACGFPAQWSSSPVPGMFPHPSCMSRLEAAGMSNWNHRFGICRAA